MCITINLFDVYINMSKRKQKSILHFFGKKWNLPIDNHSTDEKYTSNDVTVFKNTETVNNAIKFQSNLTFCNNVNETLTTDNCCLLELNNFSYDIRHFLDDIKSDDHTKFRLLNSLWKPEPSFKFSFSIHMKNGVEKNDF